MDMYGCLADKMVIKWKLTDSWIVWIKIIVHNSEIAVTWISELYEEPKS